MIGSSVRLIVRPSPPVRGLIVMERMVAIRVPRGSRTVRRKARRTNGMAEAAAPRRLIREDMVNHGPAVRSGIGRDLRLVRLAWRLRTVLYSC